MNKILILLTASLLICCCSCTKLSLSEPIRDFTTGANEKNGYEIISVSDNSSYGRNSLNYPALISDSLNYDNINLNIKQKVFLQINELAESDFTDTVIELEYTITHSDRDIVCFLFEGVFSREGAANDINFAFSLCIALDEQEIIDICTLFALNSDFVDEFRKELLQAECPERFTTEQWSSVVDYINAFSDEEIMERISSDPEEMVAFYPDAVVILFPVPSAAGDYVKISVNSTG